jgi:hypothetical protein
MRGTQQIATEVPSQPTNHSSPPTEAHAPSCGSPTSPAKRAHARCQGRSERRRREPAPAKRSPGTDPLAQRFLETPRSRERRSRSRLKSSPPLPFAIAHCLLPSSPSSSFAIRHSPLAIRHSPFAIRPFRAITSGPSARALFDFLKTLSPTLRSPLFRTFPSPAPRSAPIPRAHHGPSPCDVEHTPHATHRGAHALETRMATPPPATLEPPSRAARVSDPTPAPTPDTPDDAPDGSPLHTACSTCAHSNGAPATPREPTPSPTTVSIRGHTYNVHFDPSPEETHAVIASVVDPYTSLDEAASRHDTTLVALTLWLSRPEIQALLTSIESVACTRARVSAATFLPDAVNSLSFTLRAHVHAETNELCGRSPEALNARQRQRTDARKAAYALLRIARIHPTPPSSAPPAPKAPNPSSDPTPNPSGPAPTRTPSDTSRADADRRALEALLRDARAAESTSSAPGGTVLQSGDGAPLGSACPAGALRELPIASDLKSNANSPARPSASSASSAFNSSSRSSRSSRSTSSPRSSALPADSAVSSSSPTRARDHPGT